MRSSIRTLALAGTLLACSSGGSGNGLPAACTNAAPCGGNIVGTWTIANLCGAGANRMQTGVLPGCPSSSATSTTGATGTITFNADFTYTTTLTATGSATNTLPKSCLSGTTCAEIQTNIMQGPSASQYSSISCLDDGSNCNCAVVLAPQMNTETGTYSLSGGTLNTMPTSAGTAGTAQYCVSGTELSISTGDTMPLIIVANKT